MRRKDLGFSATGPPEADALGVRIYDSPPKADALDRVRSPRFARRSGSKSDDLWRKIQVRDLDSVLSQRTLKS